MNPCSSYAVRLAASLLTACAGGPEATPVPPNLEPPAGARWLMTVSATGVQHYECRRAADGRPAWTFVAPEAELFDPQGRPFGRHGTGPTWSAADGSQVVGSVAARADAPRPGDIPWLLLQARSTGGPGRLAAVASIQRLRTEGGIAPASGCSDTTLGTRHAVPYRADYRFYAGA